MNKKEDENQKKKSLSDLSVLMALCKQRGFLYPSSEIYGGLNSCWDYGPLGSQLKLKIQQAWWRAMTRREDIFGLDASILMHPTVWEASGHVTNFSDPLVDCKKCKMRFRADHIEEGLKLCKESCQGEYLTEPRQFNMMFQTHMGPVQDDSSVVYLRPETAQGIYVNFENVQKSMRKKLPFGIAQVGKSFRNEITPGNSIFRTREFEQMEMQYFVPPEKDEEFFEFWKAYRMSFHQEVGLSAENLRFHPHGDGELAHYAKAAEDIEYRFPFGWQELEGIHNRTDFDLKQHMAFSRKNLEYFDGEKKYIPYVVETALGLGRLFLAILCEAYHEESLGEGDSRVVLRLNPKIAPYTVAVLPLSKKDELSNIARKLRSELCESYDVLFDETQSIGKRYRRQDEIGTPFCVTVDFDSLNDQCVTVRDRDSMKQVRVSQEKVLEYLHDCLRSKVF